MRQRRTSYAWLVGLVLAAGAAAAGAATFYKWVDEHGVTHYSDTPGPGAERLQVGSAQSFHAAPVPSGGSQPSKPAAAARDGYTHVAIIAPLDGAVFINEGGKVQVSAAVEPALITGHQIWFVLDGSRLEGQSPTATAVSLDLPRGTHNVAVSITDANGTEVASSTGVSFTVRERSILTPPRGPALNPPPQPPPKHP